MCFKFLQILPALSVFVLTACKDRHPEKDQTTEPVSMASKKANQLSLTPDNSLQTAYFDSATGFYMDLSEINSNEYKEFDFELEERNSKKKSIAVTQKTKETQLQTDSIISLLTTRQWTTCGTFDSVNQYDRVQFIDKTLLKGTINCTGTWGAQSDWVFSNQPSNKTLQISNRIGWTSPNEFVQIQKIKWRWDYKPGTKNIYLYDYPENNSFKDKIELNNAKFCLIIKEITAHHLVFAPIRL